MNVVILAAGAGTRMHSALPKVLHPLAGKPLLAHVVETVRSLKPARIIVVVGHGAAQVRERMAADDIQLVLQEQQLGTGHALKQALPLLDLMLPTLVLYGDVPLTRASTLQRLVRAAEASQYALLTVTLDDPVGYGRIVRDADGRVLRIVEQKDATPAEQAIREINTGIVAMPPDTRLASWLAALENHNAQREYYLTDVVQHAATDGVEIVTRAPDDVWETLGVNSKSQLADLERIYQRNTAQRLLDAGVTLADPARIDVRGTLVCGRDVAIDIGCVFEGQVELGDGVVIGPHCVVRDATVAAGACIEAFSSLNQAQVGAKAMVGPYARLRPGTQLGEGVHVGNFVEVKNATLGVDSKANHLAYIGDAQIGARVNVGAGVITCNYDGAAKHRTVIEDDVFIGSDTQLVAPVQVGRGATVAAGTTIWKDVPADTLALNEKTQQARAGYIRPVKKKTV